MTCRWHVRADPRDARRHLAPKATCPASYRGVCRARVPSRPAERFECSGFENLSVICFANATVSLPSVTVGGSDSPPGCHSPRRRFATLQGGRQAAAAGILRQTARSADSPLGRGGLKSIRDSLGGGEEPVNITGRLGHGAARGIDGVVLNMTGSDTRGRRDADRGYRNCRC